jgi:hypothetical protein
MKFINWFFVGVIWFVGISLIPIAFYESHQTHFGAFILYNLGYIMIGTVCLLIGTLFVIPSSEGAWTYYCN